MRERSDNLTFEDVANVIEALIAEGIKPTRRKIYDKLDRGSMSTITHFARQYFESSRYKLQMSKALLSDQFLGAAVAEVKRVMSDQMKRTTLQLETAMEDLDDISRELHKAREESETCKNQIETLNEKIRRIESEAENKQTKSDARLDAEISRVKSLEQELKDVRDELLRVKSDLAVKNNEISSVDKLKNRLEKEESLNETLQAEVRGLNNEIKELMKGNQTPASV